MAELVGIKQPFTEDGPWPLPTERYGAPNSLALLSGLVFAIAVLAATLAGAEEPQRIAQAGDPELPAAASDSPDRKTRPMN